MKVAVLISGQPRFCAEFDLFLYNLQGYDQIDWFFYMWKENKPPYAQGYDLVAPSWQIINKDWALEKITSYLPSSHHVVNFELDSDEELVFPDVPRNDGVTNPHATWRMWYSMKQVDMLRQQHEVHTGQKYDLVIKTRPDTGLMSTIDLRMIKQHIDADPSLVIQPANKICGYGPVICDLFAITSSDNMSIYTNLVNEAKYYYDQGWFFHPETMLAKYLMEKRLSVRSGTFKIEFRYLGVWKDPITGRATQQNVGTYISNYGRWS